MAEERRIGYRQGALASNILACNTPAYSALASNRQWRALIRNKENNREPVCFMDDKPRKNDRQTRLAEALRANLRRRRDQSKRRSASESGAIGDEPVSSGATAVNPPQTPLKPPE